MIEGFFPHPLSLANQGQLKWHTTVIQSLQNDLNRVCNRVRVKRGKIILKLSQNKKGQTFVLMHWIKKTVHPNKRLPLLIFSGI